jgi:predicted O-methyltransferase YrrM
MTRERWAEVDRYLTELFVAPDVALEAALDPQSVSPLQGKLLHLLARLQGARAILELGTLGATARSGSPGRCPPTAI